MSPEGHNIPDTIDRARANVKSALENPRIELWPRFALRKKRRHGEIDRAKSLQTYTVALGGAALFAYVFSHREKLNAFSKEQVRGFKIGSVTEGVVSGIHGHFAVQRRRVPRRPWRWESEITDISIDGHEGMENMPSSDSSNEDRS